MYSKTNKAIWISFCCFHSNWLYPHLLLIFITLSLVNAMPRWFSVIAHFMCTDLTNVLLVTRQCLILYIHSETAGFWLPACKKCLLDLAEITVYVCHCVCLHMCHFPMHTHGFAPTRACLDQATSLPAVAVDSLQKLLTFSFSQNNNWRH